MFETAVERAHEPAGGKVAGDQDVADEGDALAVDRSLHRHGLDREVRPGRWVDILHVGCRQPESLRQTTEQRDAKKRLEQP
ncbi:MAG: hypothetical protein GDA49_01905 [Rhodospirillales bacterium]|nr:hypothetical protein [Rhodospirillales bacterium]